MGNVQENKFRNFFSTVLFVVVAGIVSTANLAQARTSRVVKFYGVPQGMQSALKKKFPFVFEREATLPEIDELVRYLMKSGNFSNVEAVDRPKETGEGRETAVIVSLLRRIQDIHLSSTAVLSGDDILKTLGIQKGQIFERKHLLNSAEELRRIYEQRGYHNAKVEIDFDLPNDNEVVVKVSIFEGDPVRISEVVVDSQNVKLATKLTSLANALNGKILTEEDLNDFQKKAGEMLTSKQYLTARLDTPAIAFNPQRTEAKLTYVVENPFRFDLKIDGNHFFTDGRITDQLEEEKLSGATSSPAADMAEKVRRMYQAEGFPNVEVSYDEKSNDREFTTVIHFKVNENPRVKISSFDIIGNISRPPSYYSDYIKTNSSDLIAKGYYVRKDIEDGTAKLITELQNQGYLRSKIQSQRATFSADNKTVTIALSLDEGPLTQIRQIRFEGIDSYPKAQLTELLKIKSGAALGLRELEESLTALKNFYHSEGFLEMKIINENEQSRIVTYNEGNTQATVTLQIYEGPRERVGTITLQGNNFTKPYVLLRELPFKTGDVLTPEKIDEAIFRLQKLDLFSRVSLRTLEEGTNIAERTIIIEVIEKNPGIFRTSIGLTNEQNYPTIRNRDTIAFNNINGTGRGISLRAEPKYSTDPRVDYLEQVVTLSYIEPFLFDDRNRGRVTLVRDEELFEIDPNGNAGSNTIMQDTNTIGFYLERDLARHIRLNYDVYSLSNESQWNRFTYAITQTVNIAKTGPMVEFDYRDNAFNPTKGSYWYTQLEYSDPLLGSSKDSTQTVNFFKATVGSTHYTPLFGKKGWTWVNQQRLGYLANVSSDLKAGIPAQETFFLGGRSTIRGFVDGAFDEKIPNWHDLGVSDYRYFVQTSDAYMLLLKTDIWFPIYGNIGGTLFYDGGNVFIDHQPSVQNFLPWRDSVGTGIRITTPVGPINVEVGFKLNRRLVAVSTNGGWDVREAPWAIHISIGAL